MKYWNRIKFCVHFLKFKYVKKEKEKNRSVKYENLTEMQTIASFLATEFQKELKAKNIETENEIRFLKVITLVRKHEGTAGALQFFNCEPLLRVLSENPLCSGECSSLDSTEAQSAEPKFLRFSNNVDFVMIESRMSEVGLKRETLDLLLCYSHWTHRATGGFLMVVDLQGVLTLDEQSRSVLLLTDPAIHCRDATRFRPLNLCEQGMRAFLEGHKCNRFCTLLGLAKK